MIHNCGGDSSQVQYELRNVQQIQAAGGAFAALQVDGSLVTWGDPDGGGDSSAVQHLRNVQQIRASYLAFAAILTDGSVVSWGYGPYGGDSSTVQDQLRKCAADRGNKLCIRCDPRRWISCYLG